MFQRTGSNGTLNFGITNPLVVKIGIKKLFDNNFCNMVDI